MCLPLPILTGSCARGAKPHGGFGLVTPPITIAYHSPDLAGTLPQDAFTKHRRLAIWIEHNTLDDDDQCVMWCYTVVMLCTVIDCG